MESRLIPNPAEISAECMCLNLQRAARLVARRYDNAFHAVGLTSGQFAILAGLNQDRPIGVGTLAAALGLERTTLTRNLAPLEADGLVASHAVADDKRIRGVALTAAGYEKLAAALPLWRTQQAISAQKLKSASWPETRRALGVLSAS